MPGLQELLLPLHEVNEEGNRAPIKPTATLPLVTVVQ